MTHSGIELIHTVPGGLVRCYLWLLSCNSDAIQFAFTDTFKDLCQLDLAFVRRLAQAHNRLPVRMNSWGTVADHLGGALGKALAITAVLPASRGCISNTALLETTAGRYFVKYGPTTRLKMFAAETEALRTIQRTGTIRTPTPICCGSTDEISFLVLEYLELIEPSVDAQTSLGRRLAALHRVHGPQFGWDRNNSIGATPQINDPSPNWAEFFREKRLRYQLALAARNGYVQLVERGERLLARMESLLSRHVCEPSLLHGDLWRGNAGATPSGEPVIFDPALYFGDREADLAMTRLFGGFSDEFYDAYEAEYPRSAGYETRYALYNWYHVLNHLNIFGTAYLGQAQRMLTQLLAEIE